MRRERERPPGEGRPNRKRVVGADASIVRLAAWLSTLEPTAYDIVDEDAVCRLTRWLAAT